jgi:hypothetical protein
MSTPAKLLVVANRTADSDEVHAALVRRAQDGPIDVTLLAPAAWEVVDPHGGKQSAWRRLNAALTRLAAAGIAARGVVGDPDPVVAVQDIWDPERFDEVIVATLPRHLSRWLGLGLPRRVEQLTGVPTRHVIASERSAVAR